MAKRKTSVTNLRLLKGDMEKNKVDGLYVIEEFLLTKGEHVVTKDMQIQFKPLVDFGIILYHLKANATNKLAMKFDLEKFFMRTQLAILSGHETKYVKVPKKIFDRVKSVNDRYRTDENQLLE